MKTIATTFLQAETYFACILVKVKENFKDHKDFGKHNLSHITKTFDLMSTHSNRRCKQTGETEQNKLYSVFPLLVHEGQSQEWTLPAYSQTYNQQKTVAYNPWKISF
uniref:Uncharacterized protein n=1 Tax=Glossina pallidipes TaxID=7398 RepID=A0A1A9ZIS7_GLOPL